MDGEHFATGSATDKQDESRTYMAETQDVRLTTQSMDWFLLKSELHKPPFKHHRVSNNLSEYELGQKPDFNKIRCVIPNLTRPSKMDQKGVNTTKQSVLLKKT